MPVREMYTPSEYLPKIGGEALNIPFVGAISEGVNELGEKVILIQTRQKSSDPKYSNKLEIPGGKYRAGESIFETVRREAKEEAGLEITSIEGETETRRNFVNDMSSDVFSPFCTVSSPEGPFIGFIFRCQATGTPASETNETQGCHWMRVSELKETIEKTPNKIYPPFFGPLKLYVEKFYSAL